MMRFLQVGVGGMGHAWTPTLSKGPQCELAGMVDVNPDVMAASAEKHGLVGIPSFTKLEDALAAVDCDAVVLVTPPPFHSPHAIIAAQAGKHVLTEKPLADSPAAAKAMVDACAAAGVTLMVSQNYRRSPAAMTVRQAVQSGVIGPVDELGHVAIEFYKAVNFGATNFRTLMEYPLLLDMGIHHVDLLRYVTGADVVSLYARSFLPKWSWYHHGDGLAMTFELSNGAVGSYLGTWSSGGKETSWNGDWRLQGTKGALLWTGDGITFASQDGQTVDDVPIPAYPVEGIPLVVQQFIESVTAGVEPPTSGRDNLRSIGIQFAALESIKRNAPVTLAELGLW
jgi:predicted dehydrogenase